MFFNECALFQGEVTRRKFHSPAFEFFAVCFVRQEGSVPLIVLTVDCRTRVAMKARAVRAECDVPRSERWIEMLMNVLD